MKLNKFGKDLNYVKSLGYIYTNASASDDTKIIIDLSPNTNYNSIKLEGYININALPSAALYNKIFFSVLGDEGKDDYLFGFYTPNFNTGYNQGKLVSFYSTGNGHIDQSVATSIVAFNHKYGFKIWFENTTMFYTITDNGSSILNGSKDISEYVSLYNPKKIVIYLQDFYSFWTNTCKLSEDGGVTEVTLTDLLQASGSGTTNAKFTAASEPVLQSLSVTPSTSAQTLTPSSGVDGFNQVNVSAVENVLPSNIKSGVTILGVTGSLEEKRLNTKYANIASYNSLPFTIDPDSNYDGMTSTVINSIGNLSAGNVKSGVTIAGVTGNVVEKVGETVSTSLAASASLPVVFTPDSGYNAIDSLTLSSIENLQASNIKSGVTIAGVTGSVNEFRPTQKDLTIAANASLPTTYYPEGSANGFSSFTVSGITNLTAANIKKDIQIAGVTGTYEGSGSSGVITVSAHNDKSSAVQAGQKVLVHKGVVSGVASYSIKDVTEISAPNYLKNYTFGVAVNAIPQAQGGSVVIPADMGTAVGKYVVNTNGNGHAYFNSYNVNDADFGSNYLGYATTQTNGYAQINLPNVPYTSIGSSAIKFAFKRIGTATEAEHLVAKVTNSWDTSKISTEETEDVFRIYLTSSSSGYTIKIQYKKTDDTFRTISVSGYYMTSVGDTLHIALQTFSSSGLTVYVNNNQIGTGSFTDLTTTENLRNYNIWNPSPNNYACEYLLAYEKDGYDELGCACSFSNYGNGYFLGGKYYY